METLNATTPELAQEIWDKLQYWQQRAIEFGVIEAHGDMKSFVLSGDTGAFRCGLNDDGGRIFWSSLTDYPQAVDVFPTKVNDADDKSFPPLTFEAGQAISDMLEPGVVEVATPVQALYGFVVQNRIVAVTFTTDVYKSSLTDRTLLGVNEDTYVVDAKAFGQLCVPTKGSIPAWYQQFWRLQQQGAVIPLSERVNNLPGEVWAHREGVNVWLEFDANDDQSPAFVVGKKYRSWLIASGKPSKLDRDGAKSVSHALRWWFK